MIFKRLTCGVVALTLVCVSVVLLYYKKPVLTASTDPYGTLPLIWIDAGHGGLDSGTSGVDGTAEKILNLAIAKKLNELLTLYGFQVKMIREEDGLLNQKENATVRENKRNDLNARLRYIETSENCILLSIHQNYYNDARYDGAQVFYSNHNPQNRLLAEAIQTSIASRLQTDNKRVVKNVGSEIFLLDRCTKPAVMIECGFMSNIKELTLLKNEDYQAKMALCIAIGLLSYYNVK